MAWLPAAAGRSNSSGTFSGRPSASASTLLTHQSLECSWALLDVFYIVELSSIFSRPQHTTDNERRLIKLCSNLTNLRSNLFQHLFNVVQHLFIFFQIPLNLVQHLQFCSSSDQFKINSNGNCLPPWQYKINSSGNCLSRAPAARTLDQGRRLLLSVLVSE